MTNGIGMEDVVFYARVGPENVKKLTASSDAAVFTIVSKDTMANSGTSYGELLAMSGFGPWMVNEAVGSLIGKGFLTTDAKLAYASSMASDVPAAVTAANVAATAVPVTQVSKDFSPPDILVPSSQSQNMDLSPEIASAISNSPTEQLVDSHAKKDAKKEKKGNMMNLMDGLSTGRLIDNISDKNDFTSAMENVGGNMGSMMEGLSLRMPSVPLDGTLPGDKRDDEEE